VVGVPDDPHADDPEVLGDRVGQLVDVPSGDAELLLDLGQARADADPELAVPRVAEELLAVPLGPRPEVDDRLVAAAVRSSRGSSTSTASGSRSVPRPVRWANAECGRNR